ncbi:MAG: hypothetical protein IKY41_09525 [Clostridia bacterium]|nr:hypothetical protein [Clostridia bacterium]
MAQNDLQLKPTQLKPTLRETARVWRRLLYSKIENIFIYENLPEEIPVRLFNLMLFKTGKLVFYKIGDKYAVQPFSYNDILNWYYVPLKGRVVNPYLPKGHQNWEFNIEDECIIYNSSPDILNYRLNSVTSDLVFKTANQLAENDISYYCIQRNSRLIALFTAETDLQKREMDKIIDKMYEGNSDITMKEDMVSHVHANPLSQNSTRNSITELIEFQQYVLANFYHSFGINSNYNLKREQLNSDEINVNQEVLRLNIEDMLKCREDGVKKINEKFGLNITVSLNEKLYATLLQQANLFQSGTIDPETGLQETQYVDTDNISQNVSQNESQSQDDKILKMKNFINSLYGASILESRENDNANSKDNTRKPDSKDNTRKPDSKDSTGETAPEKDNEDSSTRNEREPRSNNGNRRNSGGMDDGDSSETESSNRRDNKSDESHQQHETSGKSDTDADKNGHEQVSDDEDDAERGMAQQAESVHEQSSEMDTESNDTADGIHSGDDNNSDTVINIIINNAENVDVKTDEELSQNGTESEDE